MPFFILQFFAHDFFLAFILHLLTGQVFLQIARGVGGFCPDAVIEL